MTVAVETDCLADRLQVGDVVGGKYQIDAVLGRGGMGLVLSAVHQQLEERVALKFLTSSSDRVPSARSRFMREARVTAKLRGEHAARVSDFGTLDDGTPYMVMEYLDGTDLRQLLRDQGRLPVDVAIHYIAQACEGLSEAHARGVVHRDLKPSNLFLTKRPDGTDLVKIVDFGISKLRTAQSVDDDLTAAGAILGSPRYVAPEQLRDSGQVDGRADVWSLGAILYEMLAGQSPFQAESTAALCYVILSDELPLPLAGRIDGVSPALEGVVMRCLCRDPNRRTHDVAVLVGELYEATGVEGLDVLAESIRGILDRAAAEGLSATGTFGTTTGPNPSGSRIRTLGTSDSGSIRSDFSRAGMARSEAPAPQARRSPGLYVLLSAVVLAIIGAVVWTQMPAGGPTQAGSTRPAAVPPPELSSGAAGATASPKAPDAAAASDARTDAGGEASGDAGAGSAQPSSPPARWTGGSWRRPHGGSGASKPPEGTGPAPPKDTGEPRAPRDPFSDRY